MRNKLFLFCFIIFSFLINNHIHAKDIQIIPGLGNLYHPVSTKNPLAQRFFDQGLTLIYAFNHDAAYESFKKAAEIDPQLAMAYWGMALSLGQNINMEITPEHHISAFDAVQKALTLLDNTTDNERAYIEALAKRYSNTPNSDLMQLRLGYNQAMQQVMLKYPEDLDAATLYAESGMNIHPWRLWTNQREPNEGTLEIVAILESVIKREPEHLGANHYYIHAVEGSKHPEWALMSAERLQTLLPASGHILHMPSHIYILVGDYAKAAKSNEDAIRADWEYIRNYGIEGNYPIHYLSHNYNFLTRAYQLEGRFDDALKAAGDLQKLYVPHFKKMPELEYYSLCPLQVLLAFHRWQDVLQVPKPNPEMKSTTAFWHFARSFAFFSLGDLEAGMQEKQSFLDALQQMVPTALLGSNPAPTILAIAEDVLNAKVAKINQQSQQVIELLNQAILKQDQLYYNEPPDWFFPIRESLGAELLFQNRNEEALQVFKQDLEHHPRNPRSLFGLVYSLKNLHQDTDAFWVFSEFQKAWSHSTTALSLEDISL